MKERPILFQGALVRSILDGTKTQTRRLMAPRIVALLGSNAGGLDSEQEHCPYGIPGDRLWVREAWASVRSFEVDDECLLIYRADGEQPVKTTWRPSIHMPRRASRIDLEVTEVRVQRLHDITEEDARAEGFDEWIPCNVITGLKGVHVGGAHRQATCREHFSIAWDAINGKRSPWDRNDWVWAITFKRVRP